MVRSKPRRAATSYPVGQVSILVLLDGALEGPLFERRRSEQGGFNPCSIGWCARSRGWSAGRLPGRHVSILVLLDGALEVTIRSSGWPQRQKFQSLFYWMVRSKQCVCRLSDHRRRVSILVLLDGALEEINFRGARNARQVSILVLLDGALEDQTAPKQPDGPLAFQSLFYWMVRSKAKCWSASDSVEKVSILVLLDGALEENTAHREPCSFTVSILVLLDGALEADAALWKSLAMRDVSILVLLDGALEVYDAIQNVVSRMVSILVLLDGALEAEAAPVTPRAHPKFQSLFYWMVRSKRVCGGGGCDLLNLFQSLFYWMVRSKR